jgi:hypothetical protein
VVEGGKVGAMGGGSRLKGIGEGWRAS